MTNTKCLLFTAAILCGMTAAGCAESDCENGMCTEHYGVSPEYSVTRAGLSAQCTITVTGSGTKNMETDYVPNVTWCENGNSNTEGLRAQAVAARSFAYYKGNTVGDSQGDQVYSCKSRAPSSEQFARVQAATNATAGIVLRYKNTAVCSFYVSGTTVPNLDSECKTTSTAWPQSNVTYNWGKSGTGIKQSSIGWVNSGNYANRGCMSQNGATCLGNKGWVWENIVKFFYGMDIEIVRAEGSCITHPNCTTKVSDGTIIDDTDECFTRSPSEQWFVLSSGNGGSSQFAYTLNGNATATGKWSVNVSKAGTYEVFANIDSAHGSRSKKAPYTIRANGAEKSVSVDISGSGWISLGKYEFAAGGDQWVKLTDASGEGYTNTSGTRVVYDAIKFVAASSCKDSCSSNGAKQCSDSGFKTCRDTNGDGCLEWSGVESCGEGKTCSGAGDCIETCKDECTSGARKCVDTATFVVCGQHDSDSCLEWATNAESCGAKKICQNGECVDSCTDACTAGAKQCAAGGVQTCEVQDSGCTGWSSASACEADKTCSNGECVDAPCEDECGENGARECSGSEGYRTCGQYDSDSCLEWSDVVACDAGLSCAAGECKSGVTCEDVCKTGETQCKGNSVQKCGNYDDDECLEWSDGTACGSSQTCENGACVDENEQQECMTAVDGRPSTIIDDTDPCFERANAASTVWMTLPDGYENALYYAYLDDNKAKAVGTWHLKVTKAGRYKISAYVLGGVGGVPESMTYEVYASGKLTTPTVSVDEDTKWVSLGVFDLKKGTDQYVELTNLSESGKLKDSEGNLLRVLYDAIRIEPVSDTAETTSDEDDSVAALVTISAASGCMSRPNVPGQGNAVWLAFGALAGIIGMRRRRSAK